MTTVLFRRKLYAACMGINLDDSPPCVTIGGEENILNESGEAVNFENTGVNGDSLRNEVIRALRLRYELDNSDAVVKSGIYNAGEFCPDRIKSEEISHLTGLAKPTVRQWARENALYSVGDGTRKTYYWTRADLERFLQRPRPGKRARKKPPGL
jgi:hypothetical protein